MQTNRKAQPFPLHAILSAFWQGSHRCQFYKPVFCITLLGLKPIAYRRYYTIVYRQLNHKASASQPEQRVTKLFQISLSICYSFVLYREIIVFCVTVAIETIQLLEPYYVIFNSFTHHYAVAVKLYKKEKNVSILSSDLAQWSGPQLFKIPTQLN